MPTTSSDPHSVTGFLVILPSLTRRLPLPDLLSAAPNSFFGSARCSDAMMGAMASVEVKQSGAGDTMSFDVTVTEASSATSHVVTLDASQFEHLRRGDENPERFIERCFEFLLAREPKESIMSSFDVSVISRYFPEFEQETST
jgi:hypothetical protein